jgi:hypothetical protein
MKNTENKYWFTDISQDISEQTIEVECYDKNTDEKVATIELKYLYDEESDEWKVESSKFHTDPTIKEIYELVSELTYRASDIFHEFCYECTMYEEYDEDGWFI